MLFRSVATVPWPRNERSPLAGVKTTSYAEQVLALAHARAAGADEAVWADTRGRLSEGAGSNVFYVVDGELRTPSTSTGCLPGVVRGLLLEWCTVRECEDPIEVVAGAEEVFLTSTTRGVQAVSRWDDVDLPPGEVTDVVRRIWAEKAPSLLDAAH